MRGHHTQLSSSCGGSIHVARPPLRCPARWGSNLKAAPGVISDPGTQPEDPPDRIRSTENAQRSINPKMTVSCLHEQLSPGLPLADLHLPGVPSVKSQRQSSKGRAASPSSTPGLGCRCPSSRRARVHGRVGSERRDDAPVRAHIHLDHAGAAGSLVKARPAHDSVVARARGPAHDGPAELLRLATQLYGDAMDRLWGEFLPTPAVNVRALAGGSGSTSWADPSPSLTPPGAPRATCPISTTPADRLHERRCGGTASVTLRDAAHAAAGRRHRGLARQR